MKEVQPIIMQKKNKESPPQIKEDWEEIFDIINDAITIHDKDFNIVRANKAAQELLGLSGGDILNNKCFESYHGSSCPPEQCPSCKTLQTGKPTAAETYEPFLNKTLEVKALPRRDNDGNLIGLVHIVRDITREKEAETREKILQERISQIQKMEAIGTFAGGIAHDFNNILGAMIGCAELSLLEVRDNSTVYKHLTEILNAGMRARDLVKQIITFSRRRKAEQNAVEMSILVKEALKFLRASLPSTIDVKYTIDPNAGMVFADITQIHQVLMNLGSNAARAMREKGGVLDVQLKNVEPAASEVLSNPRLRNIPYVCLTMSDTGEGIGKSVIDRIYEPYFTTKCAGEDGAGLGLAIVHTIIENHGGVVNCSSTVGEGTTFEVFLPMIDRREIPRGRQTKDIPTGSERILFVDDEELLVNIETKILEHLGYQVVASVNSVEALRIFRDHPENFDLVITDQTMPEMTGIELAKEILKIRPDIKVILCTGHSEIINAVEAKNLGVHEFVLKPLDRYELANLVRKALES